jgi:hypothetical protein
MLIFGSLVLRLEGSVMVTAVRVLAWQKKTARWEGWLVCGTDVSWALALG